MKILTKILALYILTLAVLPCSDVHASVDFISAIEVSNHHQEENHDMDLCSPFCSCDCCHTVAETLEYPSGAISAFHAGLIISPVFKIATDFTYFCWNPPEA